MPERKRKIYVGSQQTPDGSTEDLVVDAYIRNEDYFAAGLNSFMSKKVLSGMGVTGQQSDAILHQAFPENFIDPLDDTYNNFDEKFLICPFITTIDGDNHSVYDLLFYHNLMNILTKRTQDPPVTIEMPFSFRGGFDGTPHAMLLEIAIDEMGKATINLTDPFGDTSGYIPGFLKRVVPILDQCFKDYESYRQDKKPESKKITPALGTVAKKKTQFDGKCCGLQLLNNVAKKARASGVVNMTNANQILPESAFEAATTEGSNSDDSLHELQRLLKAPTILPRDHAAYTLSKERLAEFSDPLDDSMKVAVETTLGWSTKTFSKDEMDKLLAKLKDLEKLPESESFDPTKTIRIKGPSAPVSLPAKEKDTETPLAPKDDKEAASPTPVSDTKDDKAPAPKPAPVAPSGGDKDAARKPGDEADPKPDAAKPADAAKPPTPPHAPSVPKVAVTAAQITNFITDAVTNLKSSTLAVTKVANDDKWDLKSAKGEPQGQMSFDERAQTLRLDLTGSADPTDPAKLTADALVKSYASQLKPEPIYLTFDAGRDDAKTLELAKGIIAGLKASNVPENDVIVDCADAKLKSLIVAEKAKAYGLPVPADADGLEVHAEQRAKL